MEEEEEEEMRSETQIGNEDKGVGGTSNMEVITLKRTKKREIKDNKHCATWRTKYLLITSLIL